MKVTSPAGELDVIITGTAVEGDAVILNANVGVWEVRVFLGLQDFKFFLSVLFRPKVLILLLKQLL